MKASKNKSLFPALILHEPDFLTGDQGMFGKHLCDVQTWLVKTVVNFPRAAADCTAKWFTKGAAASVTALMRLLLLTLLPTYGPIYNSGSKISSFYIINVNLHKFAASDTRGGYYAHMKSRLIFIRLQLYPPPCFSWLSCKIHPMDVLSKFFRALQVS